MMPRAEQEAGDDELLDGVGVGAGGVEDGMPRAVMSGIGMVRPCAAPRDRAHRRLHLVTLELVRRSSTACGSSSTPSGTGPTSRS